MTNGIDVAAALAALTGGAGSSGEPSTPTAPSPGDGSDLVSNLSSALGGDLAARLPELLKNVDLSALMSVIGAQTSGEKSDAAKESGISGGGAAALPSIVASLSRGGDERSSQRRALLNALRPFVSEKRRRAIDALVGIEKLTSILPGVK